MVAGRCKRRAERVLAGSLFALPAGAQTIRGTITARPLSTGGVPAGRHGDATNSATALAARGSPYTGTYTIPLLQQPGSDEVRESKHTASKVLAEGKSPSKSPNEPAPIPAQVVAIHEEDPVTGQSGSCPADASSAKVLQMKPIQGLPAQRRFFAHLISDARRDARLTARRSSRRVAAGSLYRDRAPL